MKKNKKWIPIEQGLRRLYPVLGEERSIFLLNYCIEKKLIPLQVNIAVDGTRVLIKYKEFGEILLKCILFNNRFNTSCSLLDD